MFVEPTEADNRFLNYSILSSPSIDHNITHQNSSLLNSSNNKIDVDSQLGASSPLQSSISLSSPSSPSSSQPHQPPKISSQSSSSNIDPKPNQRIPLRSEISSLSSVSVASSQNDKPESILTEELQKLSISSSSVHDQKKSDAESSSENRQTPTNQNSRASIAEPIRSGERQSVDNIFLEKEPHFSDSQSVRVQTPSITENAQSNIGEPPEQPGLPSTSSASITQISSNSDDISSERKKSEDLDALALSARMTEVGMLIQEVALALFEVQELRHSNSSSTPAPTTEPKNRSGKSPSTENTVDQALIKLEKKTSETSQEIANINRLLQDLSSDSSGQSPEFLNQKLKALNYDWQKVESDVQTLKEELKEDKWLVVFKTVSFQAEEMMKSLEKACNLVDEFMMECEGREAEDDTFQRTAGRQDALADQTARQRTKRASLGSGGLMSDRRNRLGAPDTLDPDILAKSFATLQKNFDSKKKHYLPSCERVLGILAKGIQSRSTKNGQVIRRYSDMKTRFTNLQDRITEIELVLEDFQNLLPSPATLVTPSPSNAVASSSQALLSPEIVPLTLSSKTKRTLSSITQYLRSSSPPSLTKNSAEGSSRSSAFRKLAARISSSTTSRSLASSSKTPSVASAHSGLAPQPGGQAPPQVGYKSSNLSQSTSTRAVTPGMELRSKRSTRKLGPSASSSRPPTAQGIRASSSLQLYHPQTFNKNIPSTPSMPSGVSNLKSSTRSRLGFTKSVSSAPTNPKPRWNISLKPVEDSPTYLSAPITRVQATSSRNSSFNSSPTTRLASAESKLNLRSRTPNLTKATMARHHQLTQQQKTPTYDRPGSAAGRSDASGITMVSLAGYRTRPVTRDCRIPGPVWDPTILPRGPLSRPQSRMGIERESRSSSGPAGVGTPMSPTPSDVERLRVLLRPPSRNESRMSHSSIPVSRSFRGTSKPATDCGLMMSGGGGGGGTEVEELIGTESDLVGRESKGLESGRLRNERRL